MRLLRGFTLIELLVTISIISILASIIYVSFGEARENSRNKSMTVELKEVQLALETYLSQKGTYPLPRTGCGSGTADSLVARSSASGAGCADSYIGAGDFIPEFISRLPVVTDSANATCVIEYQTALDGTWYKLTAINCLSGVDSTSGVASGEPLARCASSCDPSTVPCDPSAPGYYQSFAVYSLGGACR